MDSHECLVDHLLSCGWGLGDDGLYEVIFEVVIKFLDLDTWVPRGAERFLVGLLLTGSQSLKYHTQVIDDFSGFIRVTIHLYSDVDSYLLLVLT